MSSRPTPDTLPRFCGVLMMSKPMMSRLRTCSIAGLLILSSASCATGTISTPGSERTCVDEPLPARHLKDCQRTYLQGVTIGHLLTWGIRSAQQQKDCNAQLAAARQAEAERCDEGARED